MNFRHLRQKRLRGSIFAALLGTAWAGGAFAGTSTWKVNSAGSWSNVNDWTGGVPDSSDQVATFGNIITANRVITVNGTFTVKRINIDDNNNYTITGVAPNALRLEGPTAASHAEIVITALNGMGTHTISTPILAVSALDVVNSSFVAMNFNSAISGSQPLSLDGIINLGGNSTYSGATLISGEITQVTVNSVNGLGSSIEGTTIKGPAFVAFAALGSEPLTIVSGGAAEIRNTVTPTTYSAPLSLATGGKINFIKAMTFESAVDLPDGKGSITGPLTISAAATFSGPGTIEFGTNAAPVQVNTVLAHDGGVTVSMGTVAFNVTNNFPGPLRLRGTLNVNADQSVSRLVLASGSYVLAPGTSLEVRDSIDLDGIGTVNISRTGTTPVNRYGAGKTTLVGLGANYDGNVSVVQGALVVTTANALGTTVGVTTVTSPSGAVLRVNGGMTLNEPIFLNNASGISWGGALTANYVSGVTASAVIAGPLDLGAIGSYVGGGPESGSLALAGPVVGGSLTKVGNQLKITTDQSAYTGYTRVRESTLDLVDNGRLTATSNVIIERFGELNLDNRGTATSNDRLSDNIPLALRGGVLRLWSKTGFLTNEILGPVTLEYGAGKIEVKPAQNIIADETQLTVPSLTRLGGSTVDVATTGLGDSAKLWITDAPPVINGIAPAWMTVGGFFATYAEKGVVALTQVAQALDTGGPADNVLISTSIVSNFGLPTISVDRTINSLTLKTATTVDLAGHQLTLDSGGLASNANLTIRNGVLRAGDGSAGELFIHSSADIHISANISGAGAVVKDQQGTLYLSGSNTYTGPTITNGSNVGIESAAAIPSNNEVIVNGGSYSLYFTSATPVHLRSLLLRGGGTVSSQIPMDAGSYEVQQGNLFAPLSGNGTLRKTTDGDVVLRDDNRAYFGTIIIEGGSLTLGDGVTYSPYSLGMGTTFVRSGGRLVLHTGSVVGKIILDGGEVLGLGSALSADLTVTRSSDLITALPDSTSVLDTSISGKLDIAAGAGLEKTSDSGTFSVVGDAHIDGTIIAQSGVSVTPAAGKVVSGSGGIQGALNIGSGAALSPGNSPGRLSVSSASWNAGGVYIWEITRAGGTAGVDWDLLQIDAELLLASTSANPFQIRLSSLAPSKLSGLLVDFDARRSYIWPIATAQNLKGFSPELISLNTGGFLNGLQNGKFDIIADKNQISLRFTAVPEPTSGLMVLACAAGLLRRNRHRHG